MHGAPVGHHQPVKAPVSAQYVRQKPLVLAAIFAVDLVIGAHHRRGAALFDDDLEHLQINFAHGAHVGDGISHKAIVFGIVEGEVLDAGGDAFALDALHLRRRQFAGEKRVFGKIFEVAPRRGAAFDVRARAQNDVHAVFVRLFADGAADFAGVFFVPAAGERRRRGEGGGGEAARDAVVAPFSLYSEAVRAVRHAKRRDAEAGHGVGVHKICARNQRRLFFRAQRGEQCADIHKDCSLFIVHKNYTTFSS